VPAGDVDEQCSRVEVVEDGAAAEDLAASGGDDAALMPIVSDSSLNVMMNANARK
jgi:hypothetical protein